MPKEWNLLQRASVMFEGIRKRHVGVAAALAVVAISCSEPPPVDSPPVVTGPRDLYDLSWAKSLSLETARVVEGARVTQGGVTLIELAWTAFDHPFVTSRGSVAEVPWRQRGALCVPTAPRPGVHQAVLYNLHDSLGGTLERAWCVGIAAAFGVPVMVHGWAADVVAVVDGKSFHSTQFDLMARLLAEQIEHAEDLPLDGRYLVGTSALTKGDMVAITVLQRMVERELGVTIDEVGSLGISKEGQSHWLLAAVDDRVAVSAPGGAYAESASDLIAGYRDDWSCQLRGGAPPEFIEVWRLFDWVLTTPAGELVDRVSSPSRWTDQIMSRHLLISGDLGVPSLGQHDVPWPQLAENRFLDQVTVPFQYVRAWGGAGVNMGPEVDDNARSLLPQLADILIDGTVTPTTPSVTTAIVGRQVSITASSRLSPTVTTVEAKVIYAMTSDRSLRGPDAQWTELAMTPAPGSTRGTFVATLPPVPIGQQLTYVVAVRERVDRAPIAYWRGASQWPQVAFELPVTPCTMPRWR